MVLLCPYLSTGINTLPPFYIRERDYNAAMDPKIAAQVSIRR